MTRLAALQAEPAAAPVDAAALRRVDWRFLLPDAALGSTAVAGPADDDLLAGLAAVARDVRSLAGGAALRYDVVVVTDAAPGDVARATRHVRAGGWLYAETTGRRAAACARRLRAAGFREVELHWLWPSAAACREMIPLAHTHAVLAALDRRDPGARLRLRARAAAALARTPALRLALPAVAVTGSAP
jgi:hypothetical protein